MTRGCKDVAASDSVEPRRNLGGREVSPIVSYNGVGHTSAKQLPEGLDGEVGCRR